MVPRRAVGLSERDGFHAISLEDGDELLGSSIVLALGVQYRRLPIPHLAAYEGLGVVYATDSARQQLRPGDDAVVVGGANSAGQCALALARGRPARSPCCPRRGTRASDGPLSARPDHARAFD